MASKTKKQVTSQDRISAGLDPWSHEPSLREYILDPRIIKVTLPMLTDALGHEDMFAKNILLGKALSASEVHALYNKIAQSVCHFWTPYQGEKVLELFNIRTVDMSVFLENRLRAINARYRKSIQMGLPTKPTIKEAMDAVCDALRSDPDYRMGWQANIAVPFQDTCKKHKIGNRSKVHVASNEAANWFLDLLLMKPDEVGERDLADEIERSVTSKAPMIVHTYTGNGEHTAVKVKSLKNLP